MSLNLTGKAITQFYKYRLLPDCFKRDGHLRFGWDSGFKIQSLTSIFQLNVLNLDKWPIFYHILIFKASSLWADAFYKSKCPSVCLSVCLSVCVFTFEVPFKRLFAPTYQSRMSNIVRDLESLGKSDGKKWSHIWTFFFENCQKLPRKKKFFFADFALQNMVETTLPDGLETSGQRAYR